MSDIAIKINELGKMYKLFTKPGDKILDAFGILNWFPGKKNAYKEFWALRDINIEVKKGKQLGIIGSNGAGKSTLLKIISGNTSQTNGSVEVNGKIQALMNLGAGFHPEFTGYENIQASLAYQGFNSTEIKAAENEIAEFTELGQFLEQPIKTYSSGMLARLAFTTSTVIKPEILIIDEILGSGDAYFLSKCKDRMGKLIESGASILLVSHALDQITQLCNEAIWLERGRLVEKGPSMEVVKAYEQYSRMRTDRRLKAKNYKRQSASYSSEYIDRYGDTIVLRYVVEGKPESRCDISEVNLIKDEEIEESLLVGDAQDSSSYHHAYISLDDSNWSKPQKTESSFYRSLSVSSSDVSWAAGNVVFSIYAFFVDADYSIETKYRSRGTERIYVEVWKNGIMQFQEDLKTDSPDWTRDVISIEHSKLPAMSSSSITEQSGDSIKEEIQLPTEHKDKTVSLRRWPSEGSLTIEKVVLLDNEKHERTIFNVGEPITIQIQFRANKSDIFKVLPAVSIYRIDGILITHYLGNKQCFLVQLESGQKRSISLEICTPNLGDGNYIFSVALFKEAIEESQRYDLIDRSYEFEIIGNDSIMANTVFHVPGKWILVSDNED